MAALPGSHDRAVVHERPPLVNTVHNPVLIARQRARPGTGMGPYPGGGYAPTTPHYARVHLPVDVRAPAAAGGRPRAVPSRRAHDGQAKDHYIALLQERIVLLEKELSRMTKVEEDGAPDGSRTSAQPITDVDGAREPTILPEVRDPSVPGVLKRLDDSRVQSCSWASGANPPASAEVRGAPAQPPDATVALAAAAPSSAGAAGVRWAASVLPNRVAPPPRVHLTPRRALARPAAVPNRTLGTGPGLCSAASEAAAASHGATAGLDESFGSRRASWLLLGRPCPARRLWSSSSPGGQAWDRPWMCA